ncbi:hypothetical protein D3C78_1378290 [compost metagenome]
MLVLVAHRCRDQWLQSADDGGNPRRQPASDGDVNADQIGELGQKTDHGVVADLRPRQRTQSMHDKGQQADADQQKTPEQQVYRTRVFRTKPGANEARTPGKDKNDLQQDQVWRTAWHIHAPM